MLTRWAQKHLEYVELIFVAAIIHSLLVTFYSELYSRKKKLSNLPLPAGCRKPTCILTRASRKKTLSIRCSAPEARRMGQCAGLVRNHNRILMETLQLQEVRAQHSVSSIISALFAVVYKRAASRLTSVKLLHRHMFMCHSAPVFRRECTVSQVTLSTLSG